MKAKPERIVCYCGCKGAAVEQTADEQAKRDAETAGKTQIALGEGRIIVDSYAVGSPAAERLKDFIMPVFNILVLGDSGKKYKKCHGTNA